MAKKWPSRLKPHPQDFLSDPVDWYTNIVDWIIKVCYNPIGWTSKSNQLECPCFEFCSSQPFQNLKLKKLLAPPSNTSILHDYKHMYNYKNVTDIKNHLVAYTFLPRDERIILLHITLLQRTEIFHLQPKDSCTKFGITLYHYPMSILRFCKLKCHRTILFGLHR